MTNFRTTDLIPSNQLPLGDRLRLGAIRAVAVGLLAAGAATFIGGAAGASPAKPPTPFDDLDDITVETVPPETIPPTVPTTIKPPVGPWATIPPVFVDPGSMPTTTVAPTPPADEPPAPPAEDPAPAGGGSAGSSGNAGGSDAPEPAPAPTAAPIETVVADPALVVDAGAMPPTADAGGTEIASDTRIPERDEAGLGTAGVVGLSLVGAGALVGGAMLWDRRRRAEA